MRLADALEAWLLEKGDSVIWMNYFGLTMREILLRISEENESTQVVGMLAARRTRDDERSCRSRPARSRSFTSMYLLWRPGGVHLTREAVRHHERRGLGRFLGACFRLAYFKS